MDVIFYGAVRIKILFFTPYIIYFAFFLMKFKQRSNMAVYI